MKTMLSLRRRGRSAAALTVAAAVTLAAGVAAAAPAEARPHRGYTKWSVILCKYKGTLAEPHSKDWYRDFLTTQGNFKGGNADYWRHISNGAITLDGSVVRGWYSMNKTVADHQAAGYSRWQRIQDCVNAAANAATPYHVPAGNRIVVITNKAVDSGAAGGRVLLDPGAQFQAFAAHEMGHGYGLEHSFSDDPTYQNAPWSQIGEYDDEWDLMSVQNAHMFATTRFGLGGPGLNGHNVDRMGWMPRNKITTVGAAGETTRTLTLTAVNKLGQTGWGLVRIPFDPSDLTRYYTVELRAKTAWDRGIPATGVLIHEVKNSGKNTWLLKSRGDRTPLTAISRNGVTVQTNWVNATTGQASVTITSNIAQRCLQGYVWREAGPGDLVCVLPSVRTANRIANDSASQRWVWGPYGPHTCIQGYVWREAFPGDDVCVTPEVRTATAYDNSQAAARRNPARFVYGPNTCKAGYVWREVDQKDYVCVAPSVRSRVKYDNSLASVRRQGYGAYGYYTCKQGFVWREAFPADKVCVYPSQRTQAKLDNAQANARLRWA
ncbi:MAG TPA: hypothetical protein VEZ46_13305 [Mycobacteriales bacterium]|nr:hypothetical protein [Mycobacteriales bacterium]